MAACGLYALNRCLLKPHLDWSILHFWFNDTLLIPCALPPLLFAYRILGLRRHDAKPSTVETVSVLIGWSILFEWIGPHLIRHTKGDPLDVIAYAAGALFAQLWWNWRYQAPATIP